MNGYDENFEGWGCEDDDLRLRLRRSGVRIRSILPWTYTYHLWHPTDASFPRKWREGRNVEYLKREGALICCRNGLVKRRLEDIRLRVVGAPPPASLAHLVPSELAVTPVVESRPEVEIVFSPGGGKFSGHAECNLLVVLNDSIDARRLSRKAHVLVTDDKVPAPHAHRVFALRDLNKALISAA